MFRDFYLVEVFTMSSTRMLDVKRNSRQVILPTSKVKLAPNVKRYDPSTSLSKPNSGAPHLCTRENTKFHAISPSLQTWVYSHTELLT